jgi:hypothetical protein
VGNKIVPRAAPRLVTTMYVAQRETDLDSTEMPGFQRETNQGFSLKSKSKLHTTIKTAQVFSADQAHISQSLYVAIVGVKVCKGCSASCSHHVP